MKDYDYAFHLTSEQKASIILFGDVNWYRDFDDSDLEHMVTPGGERISFRDLVNRIEAEAHA